MVYISDQESYAEIPVGNISCNRDLIAEPPLKRYKAAVGKGANKLDMVVQFVTACGKLYMWYMLSKLLI